MSCRPIESSACWTPDRTTDDRKPPIWRDADLPDAADDAALLAPPLGSHVSGPDRTQSCAASTRPRVPSHAPLRRLPVPWRRWITGTTCSLLCGIGLAAVALGSFLRVHLSPN